MIPDNSYGNARGAGKRRTIGTPVTNTPSIGIRPAGAANIVKTTFLNQASFRNGDELAVHRGSSVSVTMFDPAGIPPSVNYATVGMKQDVMDLHATQQSLQLDFKQVLAQVVEQNALIPGVGLGSSNVARNVVQRIASYEYLLNKTIMVQLAQTAKQRNFHQPRLC